jgi:hypothetical protein
MKMQVRDSTFDFLKPLNNLPFEDTSSLLAVALMAIWRADDFATLVWPPLMPKFGPLLR